MCSYTITIFLSLAAGCLCDVLTDGDARDIMEPSDVAPILEDGQAAASANWVEYWDEAGGRAYYYNETTGASTYNKPANFGGESFGKSEGAWQRMKDPDTGKTYYFNEETSESTFVRPPEFQSPRRPEDGQEPTDVGHDDWERYFDDEDGVDFYYNKRTDQSQYIRPDTYDSPRNEEDDFADAMAAMNEL